MVYHREPGVLAYYRITNKKVTTRLRRLIVTAEIIVLCLILSNQTANGMPVPESYVNFIECFHKDIGSSSQLIFVVVKHMHVTGAKVYTFEKKGYLWNVAMPAQEANVGRHGLAAVGNKIEGDMKTPSGIFHIGIAFGYEPLSNTKITYRQIKDNDFWVDDVNSDDYNKWVASKPNRGSFEIMRRKDAAYRYGFIVDYNTLPVVKGKGSAIFFHVWKGETKPTGGCIALSEENILKLIKWLDPEKHPKVIIACEADIVSEKLRK